MTNVPVHAILQPTSNVGSSQAGLEHPLPSDYKLFKPSIRPVNDHRDSPSIKTLALYTRDAPKFRTAFLRTKTLQEKMARYSFQSLDLR